MTFDAELMLGILRFIEKQPTGQPIQGSLAIENHSQEVSNEHMQLLIDEAYIDAKSVKNHVGVPIAFVIFGLTMKAHNFLANARNEIIWNLVMSQTKEKGISVSINILNDLLERSVRKHVGL